MKILLFLTMITLCIVAFCMQFSHADASVPLVMVTIQGGANSPSCGNACITPQNVTVSKGTAVEWINNDLVPHSITSGIAGHTDSGVLFNSGSIFAGKFFIHNFNDIGSFHYFDPNYTFDAGTITVTESPIPISLPLHIPINQTNSNDIVQNVTYPSNPIQPIPSSILHSPVPTLTPSENQSVVNVVLSIPDLQKWSHDWKYVDTSFLGNNKLGIAGGFEWQYAIVDLKAPSSSAPIPCDNDWWAWVEIDMTTMKVVTATYPTMESHQCEIAMGGGSVTSHVIVPVAKSPLKQILSGIPASKIVCNQNFQLIIKSEDSSPACVTLDTANILLKRGWATNTPSPIHMTNTKTNDPFGITALIIYHPQLACLSPPSNTTMPSCPPNNFYLKINSNSTAYLLGYNICDEESCTKRNNLSVLLPINIIMKPDYQMMGLPVNLQWKYGDTVHIQVEVSPDDDNKTASLIDLGNSAIVP